MKQYNTILFDLDGTITDTGVGITNGIMYALDKFDIHVKDRTELYRFIGPTLVDSFMQFYGFSNEDAHTAIEYYREYYRPKGIYENTLYDGIKELLESLKNAGKTILLATSKPEEFAKNILKQHKIDGYFTYIAGATFDGRINTKEQVIEYALESANIKDKSDILMVGDRKFDVIGAKQIGIDCVGVLFGYGNREELTEAGAEYIAENTDDIRKIVLGK